MFASAASLASCTSTAALAARHPSRSRRAPTAPRAHRVELQHAGGVAVLDVPEGTYILRAALDSGLDVPHDCQMGVCMNCAARLVSPDLQRPAYTGLARLAAHAPPARRPPRR